MAKLIASAAMMAFVVASGGSAAAVQAAPLSTHFILVGDYPLGAGTNRTDYESIDAVARRLYISKMGAGQLLVFDIDANRIIAALDGYPKTTGVLVVPELHKVYSSVPGGGVVSSLFQGLGMAGLSSGHGTIAVRDTRTLKELARLPGGVFPDGIAYDPKDRRVFVSDEMGSAVTAIDADTDRPVARIATGGEVGNVRYDPATAKVYVPDQSHNELLAIDPAGGKIVSRHPTTGGEHPHGFIVAPKGGIGYIACDENDRLLTVDLASGRILGEQPVAHDPDVLALDPDMNRLYVAGESGNLSTYDIAVPETPKSLGDVFAGEGAHAVAVDPKSHRLYLALADLDGKSALRVLAPKAK